MNKEILEKVAEKWKSEDLKIVSPYSDEQIKNAFDKIGKPASKDILQIYTAFGGIADWGMDSNLLGFWTLEQIVDENLKIESDFALFGDFFIFTYLYGYKYVNENVSSVYSNSESEEYTKVADSVEEFFNLYLTDPVEIGLYQE